MPSLFETLGYRAGRAAMKGRCLFQALTGSGDKAVEAEYLIGRDLATEILRQSTTAEDQQLVKVVEHVGARLASKLTDKRLRFAFLVLEAQQPNAFALPGGFVFVNSAMLALCNADPDETAFVLGHEIGHIVQRHAVERLLVNHLFASLARTVAARNLAGTWLRQAGTRLLASAYSRDNETEADEFAVRLAHASGFKENGGTLLLERLKRNSTSEQSGIGEYFASHPPLADRIQRIQELLN